VSILEEFLSIRYGAHLQSVSVRDFLLYADFLPGSDELLDMPLDALIQRMEAAGMADREAESDDPRSMNGDSGPNPTVFTSDTNFFVDLEVVCVDSGGSDLQLPSVRVYLNPTKQKRVTSSSAGGAGKKERREKIGAAFTSVRKRLFGWGKKA
jgi:Ubiquitin fold domain